MVYRFRIENIIYDYHIHNFSSSAIFNRKIEIKKSKLKKKQKFRTSKKFGNSKNPKIEKNYLEFTKAYICDI